MSAEPLRIGLLGSAESPYVADLLRAAAERTYFGRQLELNVFRFSDLFCQIGLGESGARVGLVPLEAGGLESSTVDAVMVRTMPLGSLEQVIFRMDCLQVLQRAGVPVVNPPQSLEVAIDKWLTLHRLEQLGVAVPPTLACQSRATAMAAFEQLGGDVLVKPIFGGEGRGIVRLHDPDMAWRVFGTLQQVGQVLYVQQFCPHFGYDVRVLFIGERVFSIQRVAEAGGWKTNVAQGSRALPYELSEQQLLLARQAAAAVGGSVLGVDLLPCRDGRLLVLEVNAVPGWRGLAQALKIDVAAVLLEHVAELAATASMSRAA